MSYKRFLCFSFVFTIVFVFLLATLAVSVHAQISGCQQISCPGGGQGVTYYAGYKQTATMCGPACGSTGRLISWYCTGSGGVCNDCPSSGSNYCPWNVPEPVFPKVLNCQNIKCPGGSTGVTYNTGAYKEIATMCGPTCKSTGQLINWVCNSPTSICSDCPDSPRYCSPAQIPPPSGKKKVPLTDYVWLEVPIEPASEREVIPLGESVCKDTRRTVVHQLSPRFGISVPTGYPDSRTIISIAEKETGLMFKSKNTTHLLVATKAEIARWASVHTWRVFEGQVKHYQLGTIGNFRILLPESDTLEKKREICGLPPPEPFEKCGNGVLDPFEECDPPGKECEQGKICIFNCRCATLRPPDPNKPGCGNGRIEPGEECEPPGAMGPGTGCPQGKACGTGCKCYELPPPTTTPDCGNKVTESGERCDPPNSKCEIPFLFGPIPGRCNSDCTECWPVGLYFCSAGPGSWTPFPFLNTVECINTCPAGYVCNYETCECKTDVVITPTECKPELGAFFSLRECQEKCQGGFCRGGVGKFGGCWVCDYFFGPPVQTGTTTVKDFISSGLANVPTEFSARLKAETLGISLVDTRRGNVIDFTGYIKEGKLVSLEEGKQPSPTLTIKTTTGLITNIRNSIDPNTALIVALEKNQLVISSTNPVKMSAINLAKTQIRRALKPRNFVSGQLAEVAGQSGTLEEGPRGLSFHPQTGAYIDAGGSPVAFSSAKVVKQSRASVPGEKLSDTAGIYNRPVQFIDPYSGLDRPKPLLKAPSSRVVAYSKTLRSFARR